MSCFLSPGGGRALRSAKMSSWLPSLRLCTSGVSATTRMTCGSPRWRRPAGPRPGARLTGAGTPRRCRRAVSGSMTTPLRAKPDYQLITDPAEFGSLIDRLIAEAKPVGYDVETSYEGEPRPDAQKHPEENFICGFSLTNSLAWARAIPIAFR